MPDLRIANVTAQQGGAAPKAAPKVGAVKGADEPRFIALRCPNEKCNRVMVRVAAEGQIRTTCRDCKTRAIFHVDANGVRGFEIEEE
ncbi:hypothetical protein KKE60_04990 [Patescibacteria group bacterium]|nr:hypothetical protein [Patescibacteria group bacterium]